MRALAVCGLLLAGCTSSGETTIISGDTALISVVGESGSERAAVVDKTLAEAARFARERGYRYFVIVNSADASQKGRKYGAPAQRRRNGASLPGAAFYMTADQRVPYVRYGLDVTIRMYREGDINPASRGVWNTDVILGAEASK